MADDPFSDLGGPQAAPEPASVTREPPKPLTLIDRLAMTLFLDTQPKKRAQYLAERGWEMDPKDENKYRPIGSKEKFLREVDPFGGTDTSIKEWGKEMLADTLEMGAATAQGAAEEAAGLGAALPGLAAGPAGAAAARAAGRTVAFNMFESGKDIIADWLIEKDVPTDIKLRGIQTAYNAMIPDAIRGGVNLGVDAVKGTINGVVNGVRKLYKLGGGGINDTLWGALQKDWKLLGDDAALRGAGDAIDDYVDQLYGMEKGSKQIPKSISDAPDSLFAKKLTELDAPRRAEANKLAVIPEASFSREELLTPLLKAKEEIESKNVLSDTVDEPALAWINERIKQLGRKGAQSYTFAEVDDVVKTLQKDAYKGLEPWRSSWVQPLVEDVNNQLKSKASALGSPYAQIKAQESAVFNAFKTARGILNKDNARKLIVQGLPTGTASIDVNTKALTKAVSDIDEALGTQITDGLRSQQIYNGLFSAMQASSKPRGSLGVLSTAGGIGATTAGLMSTNPITAPLAVPAGLLAGGATAATLIPEVGLRGAAAASNLGQLAAAVPNMAPNVTSAVSNALTKETFPQGEVDQLKVEDDDPFKDL